MLRVRAGDRAAFDRLLLMHRPSVVQLLNRMVRNEAVAEELAQDVFLRIYRSRHAYLASARFTTWLYRIAMNAALNWLRDERIERYHEPLEEPGPSGRERTVPDATLRADQAMLWRARLDEIRDAVFALPPKQRAAVLMHKYNDLSYSQIAEALGCSVPAVKSLLFRAYETLRARLADQPAPKPTFPV
jgi:RNA polymerase sigma-70 factor (ECF subfamily)